MKSFLLCTIVTALVAPPVQAQCSPSERGGFSGGSISFVASGALASVVSTAVDYWNTGCPGSAGQKFPSLASNNSQASLQVPVAFNNSDGVRCGKTTWTSGNPPQPVQIDLYATSGGFSCQPIYDSLAHEIGHVLGLGDAPAGTTCSASIMGERAPGGNERSVTSSDCDTADRNWKTPAETPPPPPPVPDPGPGGCVNNCDDGTFSTTGAGSEPLVINLSGPYRLSGLDDPVSFDIRADGHPLTIGWTARDADVAFLVLDRNGNGHIDDGSELFGNATPLSQGDRAPNGFEALAQYDSNGDGLVDARDPVWSRLQLWVDSNHNGVSEPAELRTVADSPITAMEFQYHWTGRRDQSGNRFGYEGHLHEGKRVQSFYDVFFVTASQP